MLAHIRSVDTTNKIPLEMVADGEFAVLVANRFPPPGANTIHLVSLEGWGESDRRARESIVIPPRGCG